MKAEDNGTNAISTEEKLNTTNSPHELEEKLELINSSLINIPSKSKKREDPPEERLPNSIKDKMNHNNERNDKEGNKAINSDLNTKTCFNNINNFFKNETKELNVKNGINNIDFDKNIIIINKQNLKDLNSINKEIKEIKNEKKNELMNKKGEIINIFLSENINYNKDLSNSIKSNYEKLSENFSDSFDNFGQIKSNSEFPNEVIEKFFEKKRNKYKEKSNFNYTFGVNPLESIKDVQNNIFDPQNTQKNGKISSKQLKINQKNLKEQNILLQKYIKSFIVFNSPEAKIFKLNKNYFINKINDGKNINIFNNQNIKIMKNSNNFSINTDKEESEEETIDRHKKKKFINKKRNKS